VNSTSGIAGGYQLGAGATLPPLLLDDEEAVAVAVGLRTAASGTVTGIEEASVRALAKLQQVLPSRLRKRVTGLHSFIVPLANSGPMIDAETLSRLTDACRDNHKLQFRYQSKDGASSIRDVEPHRLVHTGRRWYLVAWDLNRDDWRTFRVDRIEQKVEQGERFSPRKPPEGGFATFAARSVTYVRTMHEARITFHAPLKAVAERIPPDAGILESDAENRCVLRTGASSLDALSVYLALVGFEFEVHEPSELVERVRWLGEQFSRAADRSSP
jgi:predicted DNA-binding transcriptional regulator YafY